MKLVGFGRGPRNKKGIYPMSTTTKIHNPREARYTTDRPVRPVFSLIEFDHDWMRDLIVQAEPDSAVLQGKVLTRIGRRVGRRNLLVTRTRIDRDTHHLDIYQHDELLATATATRLHPGPSTGGCPRCGSAARYALATASSVAAGSGVVLTGCRDCGWRSGLAEFDLDAAS